MLLCYPPHSNSFTQQHNNHKMDEALLSPSSASSQQQQQQQDGGVFRHILLYDVFGKGLFNIIDVVGILIAIRDDGDNCVETTKIDADDFLVIGSITSLLFWFTILVLDSSYLISKLLLKCGVREDSHRYVWIRAFGCGRYEKGDGIEIVRGQNQIYGVEIIALAILIILALVIYAEMNALCRENHLGVVLITWIGIKLTHIILALCAIWR